MVKQAAAVLAAGLRKWIDLGVICALLVLNAGVGFIQEFKAGSIVHELKKTLANKCTVMRNGDFKEIEARFLVPGDIVSLEEGSIVPADGRIVTPGVQLQVDQSAITGESLAASKHTDDTLFQSSTIKRGEANIVVTAIGDKTFIGRSAALVTAAASAAGHFTEVINRIGTVLLVLVVITLIVVWISAFFRSTKIVDILKYGPLLSNCRRLFAEMAMARAGTHLRSQLSVYQSVYRQSSPQRWPLAPPFLQRKGRLSRNCQRSSP